MQWKIGALAALASAVLLSGCGGDGAVAPAPTETSSLAAPSSDSGFPVAPKAELAAARKEALANWKQITLPRYAPPAPVTGGCQTTVCETGRVQFERNDWPKAWRGNYQGQRNAAYCRSSGCDGAVIIDKIDACAWRTVIDLTQEGKIDETDRNNRMVDCNNLSEADRDKAIDRAGDIARTIVWAPKN